MELTTDLEHPKVCGHVELVRGIGTAQKEVEAHFPPFSEAFLGGDDDVARAEGFGVGGFVGRVGQGVSGRTEGDTPLQAEMTEAADSDYTDGVLGTNPCADERGVGGDAGT